MSLLKMIYPLISVAALAMNAIQATAQNKNTISRKDLLEATPDKRSLSSVKIVEITFPAGQQAPYHEHPCPVVGYIVSGTCLLQVEGESPKILKAGDAFYEPANTPIVHFDNYSAEDSLTFVACYLIDKEESLIKILPIKTKE